MMMQLPVEQREQLTNREEGPQLNKRSHQYNENTAS